MTTAPKGPVLIETRAFSDDLHLLALRVVMKISDNACYADPDAARRGYRDGLTLTTRHSIRLTLERFDFVSLLAVCTHRDAKAGTNRAA